MDNLNISRRTLGVGLAGAAVVASMGDAANAAMAAGGNWMDMVKAHHGMIVEQFDTVIAAPVAGRMPALKKLGYLLTAHSVAEENVLYPAIAAHGMAAQSDKLYIDQAHAKVGNAMLDMNPSAPDFTDKVRALKTAVLQHAKGDEEGDQFPKLMQTASAAENARMTKMYKMQFDSVKPA